MKRKDIYTEAWNITWKYKNLWIFGFVAGITLNTKSGTTDYFSSGAWLFQHLDTLITSNTGVMTIFMAGISILLWLTGLVARAGLIHGVARTVKTNRISLKTILPVGFSSLPKLVGMQIIVWLPFTILAIITAFQTPQMPIGNSGFSFLDFASTSVLAVTSFVLFFGLSFVDTFAFRLIVLGSQSIIGSIQRAGQIVRYNWKRILKTAVVCGILGLIFSGIVGIPLAPLMAFLMVPIAGPVQEAMKECTANNTEFEAISKCVQGIRMNSTTYAVLLPTSLIIAGVYSIWTTFLSAVFTLLYKDIFNVSVTVGRRKRRKEEAA